MVDTVEQAVYKLALDDGQYTAAANRAAQANQTLAQSADKLAVSEEKVTNATRLSEAGWNRLAASVLPAERAKQQYQSTLAKVAAYEQAGIAPTVQAAAAVAAATARYESHIASLNTAAGAQAAYGKVAEAARGSVQGLAQSTGLLGNSLSAIGPAGLAVAAGIGAAALAFGKFVESANQIAEKSEALKRFSETTGLTTNQVQSLGKAAKDFGLTTEDIEGSIQKFSIGFSALREGAGPLVTAIRRISPALADQMQATNNSADALLLLQQAFRSTDDTFLKSQLGRAAGGRGGPRQISFFENADFSKLNSDIAAIGYGLDAGIIAKTTKLAHEIEDVDKKIQHAFGADFAPFFLRLELGWKSVELAALKATGGIGQKIGSGVDSLADFVTRQGFKLAIQINPNLSEEAKARLKAQVDAVDLELQKKPVELDVKFKPNSLREVQNAVFGSIDEQFPHTNRGNELSGAVAGTGTIDASIESYKKLQAVFGNLLSVEDQVAQKNRELMQAQQSGIAITQEQTASLIAQARIQAEQSQIPGGQYQRQLEELNKLKAAYPGLTAAQAEGARQLDNHLKLAQAVTVAEKMMVQEAINYQNALKDNTPAQARAIALKQTAIAQAQINASAAQELFALQNQFAAAQAVTGVEKMRADYEATIAQKLQEHVPLYQAVAIAEQQLANAQAQVNAGVTQQVIALQQQTALASVRGTDDEASVAANIARTNALNAGADAMHANALYAATLASYEQKATESAKQRLSVYEQQASFSAQSSFSVRSDFGGIAPSKPVTGIVSGYDPRLSGDDMVKLWLLNHGVAPSSFLNPPVTSDSLDTQVNKTLQNGGGVQGALTQLQQKPYDPKTFDMVEQEIQKLIGLMSGDQKQSAIQSELARVSSLPETLARDAVINQLTEELKQNTDAVNSNTGALSDLYQTDPRFSHIGFRASSTTPLDVSKLPAVTAPPLVPGVGGGGPLTGTVTPGPYGVGVNGTGASGPVGLGPGGVYTDPRTGANIHYLAAGGIMTAYGPMPLRRYEGGGVANSPQLAMFGEGDGPEAFVPLKDGAIPVRFANDNGGRGDTKVDNHFGDIIINGSVDASTLDKIKLSQFQQAQDVKRAIGVRK